MNDVVRTSNERAYTPDLLLHVLRNPHGWSAEAIREARLNGADEIERLRKENRELRAVVSIEAKHNCELLSERESALDIGSILRFVKQSIFSKRRVFFEKLESLANAHLDDKSLRLKWPDALTVLTDDDWIAATLSISDSVALHTPETSEPQSPVERALGRRVYLKSDRHLSGYRLVVGFETLTDIQAAHQEVADIPKLCPHGMPLAENICGPCSKGEPNTPKAGDSHEG